MNKKLYQPKLPPKAHQVVGISELRSRKVANFDDPGMGKAKQAYDTVALMFQEKEIDLAVIAMSSSLKGNFLKEISADADQLIANVVEGEKSQRLKTYKYPGSHVLILSYETLVRDQDVLEALFKKFRVFFALDEAHRIKNLSSQMSKAALRLSESATKTAVFTGTPIPNRTKDIYPLMKFLGLDVGDDLNDFRDRFPSMESLRTFIIENSVRRRKASTAGINLPDKTIHAKPVELSDEERRIYEDISEKLVAEFKGMFGRNETLHIQCFLSKLLRLIQFSSNPNLLGADIRGSKLKMLEETSKGILSDPSEKLIIWTSFRENVTAVLENLKGFNPVHLIGGMGREELMSAANKFQDDESCRVLVAIPACAREGFTLTRARNAIYLDRNFSALDWLQSQDRIHRIGQTKPVRIFLIEAQRTIDQRIDEILKRKESIQSYLVGDVETLEDTPFVNADQVIGLLIPN